METYNGDEQQLLEKVGEGMFKRFPRKLHVSKYPIALDQKVQDFEGAMCFQRQSEQTRVMGIVGPGGVGKTTLAKEFFNRLVSTYDRSCFLSDVRDKPLNSLQTMLLKDLAQWNGQINSSDEGIELLRRYLSSCKALIILDDVDHIQQMNALLLPVKDVLQPGSLILATSRNKDVLRRAGIVDSSIYIVPGLDRQHSEKLFCWHAFQQSHPVEGFEQVVEKFLNACNGLPLSLVVLGAHLHGENDLKYWEALLRKSSKALPMDIQKRLKVSYDGLDEEEKQIFLDVACFCIGEDRDTAIRIWDRSGWEGERGFLNLEKKCLLAVDKQNRITMHDLVRDLGRYLAEKEPPHCQRRLWRPTDNLLNLSDQSHELSGNNNMVDRRYKSGDKNMIGPNTQIGGNLILGDNSGNTNNSGNKTNSDNNNNNTVFFYRQELSGNNNMVDRKYKSGDKNVIGPNTQIDGNSILGNNSGNTNNSGNKIEAELKIEIFICEAEQSEVMGKDENWRSVKDQLEDVKPCIFVTNDFDVSIAFAEDEKFFDAVKSMEEYFSEDKYSKADEGCLLNEKSFEAVKSMEEYFSEEKYFEADEDCLLNEKSFEAVKSMEEYFSEDKYSKADEECLLNEESSDAFKFEVVTTQGEFLVKEGEEIHSEALEDISDKLKQRNKKDKKIVISDNQKKVISCRKQEGKEDRAAVTIKVQQSKGKSNQQSEDLLDRETELIRMITSARKLRSRL